MSTYLIAYNFIFFILKTQSMGTQKITIKQLQAYLNVSYNTARKDYNRLLKTLDTNRHFLIFNDLKTLKIIK